MPLPGGSARGTCFSLLGSSGRSELCEAPQALKLRLSDAREINNSWRNKAYVRLSVWGQSPKVYQAFLTLSFIEGKKKKDLDDF